LFSKRSSPSKPARLLHARIGGGQHRAALFGHEQIVAEAEIARQLRLEHAALLVDENVVRVGQIDEAGDAAGVVDLGTRPIDADGEVAAG
jgi:hypothetical protein